MTSVFLYTFYVGFGLTLVSAVLGFLDIGGDAGDLSPGGDLSSGGDLSASGDLSAGGGLAVAGDLSAGGDLSVAGDLSAGGDLAVTGDLSADLAPSHDSALGKAASISPINFQTLVAALTGFGGVGYLLSSLGGVGLLLSVVGASAGAFGTGWLIYRFQRFLVRGERPLPPTSYTGIVGKLTVPIREGGTGEVVYTQHNSRMVSAARSVDGRPIPKGEEVVILRYERGVAYVQPWRELMKQEER